MSRNTAGTYALPSGNPVSSGSVISSAWANNTLNDLATEITSSLDRQGRGAMQAPLQLIDGSTLQPSLTFAADPDTGVYRAGSNDVRLQVDSGEVARFSTSGMTVPVGLSATGQSAGAGLFGTGGGVSGAGVSGVGGGPNGKGMEGLGTGTGAGGSFTGGASGIGVLGFAGGGNTNGMFGQGAGTGAGVGGTGGTTGPGGQFVPGTAATATTPRNAIEAASGNLAFTPAVNPNSNVAFANTLTPKNIPKAWATLTTTGGGSTAVTVTDAFNVASAACDTTSIGITFASAFSSTNYAAVASCRIKNMVFACSPSTTTGMALTGVDVSPGTTSPLAGFNFRDDVSVVVHVVVFGAQ